MIADRFSASAYRIDEMHQKASRTSDASSHFQPNNVPIHTPALNAVVVSVDDEELEQSVVTKPTSNGRGRDAKALGAIVMILGGLLFLDLQPRVVAHAVAATLRSKAAANGQQLDAEWTPPINGKPWEPTPYVPIQMPGTVAATYAAGAPLPAATFYVPPVLSAAPAAIAPSAANLHTKKSKKHTI